MKNCDNLWFHLVSIKKKKKKIIIIIIIIIITRVGQGGVVPLEKFSGIKSQRGTKVKI
jgi:hypothetical protein